MTIADITLAIFTLCNSVRILAYVPQITKAVTDQSGAKAISFGTWGLFAGLAGRFLAQTLHHPSPALTGAAVGVLGVAGSLPLLRSLLSAHTSDVRLGTIAIAVLALALLAATCLPARRASRLDPAEALRSD